MRLLWRSLPRRFFPTSSGCLGWCVAVLSPSVEDCGLRSEDGGSGCHITDYQRVRADCRTVVHGDRTDDNCPGPDSDAVMQRGSALGVISDGDLLVDPAVRSDGLRGDDCPDAVLDEQCGADPIGFERQCRRRPVQPAKQKTQRKRGRPETEVNEGTELGQGAAQICKSRVLVECNQVLVADAAHPPIDDLGDR